MSPMTISCLSSKKSILGAIIIRMTFVAPAQHLEKREGDWPRLVGNPQGSIRHFIPPPPSSSSQSPSTTSCVLLISSWFSLYFLTHNIVSQRCNNVNIRVMRKSLWIQGPKAKSMFVIIDTLFECLHLAFSNLKVYLNPSTSTYMFFWRIMTNDEILTKRFLMIFFFFSHFSLRISTRGHCQSSNWVLWITQFVRVATIITISQNREWSMKHQQRQNIKRFKICHFDQFQKGHIKGNSQSPWSYKL